MKEASETRPANTSLPRLCPVLTESLPPPMQRTDDTELRELLVRLKAEHRELDAEITALESAGSGDLFTIKRLKKRKLALKDRMSAVEDQLFPDIIA
jgi:hypothetical protein